MSVVLVLVMRWRVLDGQMEVGIVQIVLVRWGWRRRQIALLDLRGERLIYARERSDLLLVLDLLLVGRLVLGANRLEVVNVEFDSLCWDYVSLRQLLLCAIRGCHFVRNFSVDLLHVILRALERRLIAVSHVEIELKNLVRRLSVVLVVATSLFCCADRLFVLRLLLEGALGLAAIARRCREIILLCEGLL